MARVQVGYDPRAEALQTTAAPNAQAIKAQYDPRASSAFQLAEALGKQQPMLDKFSEDMAADKRRKEILDTMKVPAFVAQAQEELGNGTVSGVQAGTVAPGASAVVNARTNDALGAEWGRTNVQAVIEGVNSEAALIQDPKKRADFVREKKAELLGQLPKDNDFFVSGAVAAINKEINSFENKWQSQSNAYAVEVQTRDFSVKVVDAIKSPNPDEALLSLDATWNNSGALDNNARNKLVVDTVTKQAFADSDPSVMDRIPTRFLNSDTKAQIATTKAKILEKKMSDYRFIKTMETDRREEGIRTGKTGILSRFTKGEAVDPAEFRDNPELFQFAINVKDSPRLPSATSVANAQRIRSSILNQSTVGSMDENALIGEVQNNSALNPSDREKLINEIPKLVQGNIAMNSDRVKSALTLRLDARLRALEASPNALVQRMVTGTNLRSQVLKNFSVGIQNGFEAYYNDPQLGKGQNWPTGRAEADIVDRETDRAEALLEKLTDPKNIGKPEGTVPSTGRAASGAVTQAPAAAARPTPTQADIDYVRSNPQFRQKFISTFGREP